VRSEAQIRPRVEGLGTWTRQNGGGNRTAGLLETSIRLHRWDVTRWDVTADPINRPDGQVRLERELFSLEDC
jgi:hypothetical protein